MKYPNETEEHFLKRVDEAKIQGVCLFRDDNNREKILDIIDDYLDLRYSLAVVQQEMLDPNYIRKA